MKTILAMFAVLLIAGCGNPERYRYPCQDPENWEKKECKKPYCSANGTCPEDLHHYVKKKAEKDAQQAAIRAAIEENKKGLCK